MKRQLPIIFAAAMALVPALASAQPFRPNGEERRGQIEDRWSTLGGRIETAASDGRLDRSEERDLRREHERVRRQIDRAEADGFMTRGEFARLSHVLDGHSLHITRQARDDDRRFRRRG